MDECAIRDRLQRDLHDALRARDKTAIPALRSALAAIDNASAIPAHPVPAGGGSEHFAGTAGRFGAGEAPRRGLTGGEAGRIVLAEIAERQAAAADYERAGQGGHADRLRREADVLRSALAAGDPGADENVAGS